MQSLINSWRRALGALALLVVCTLVAQAQTPWRTSHQSETGLDLWGVAAGPFGIVAVGTGGTILRSPEGIAWSRGSVATTEWLTAVAYGNGRYIAVGDHGVIFASIDGVAWQSVAQTATTLRLNNVVYGMGRFVVVGEGGTILTSQDGAAWKAVASGVTGWLRGLVYGRASEFGSTTSFAVNCWMATGQGGTLTLSSDGETWYPFASGTTADLEAAAFLSGRHNHPVAGPGGGSMTLVAVGAGGTAIRFGIAGSDVFPDRPLEPTRQPVDLGVTARFRAVASGFRGYYHYTPFALSNGEEFSSPAIAIDEEGDVFANYAVDGSGGWTRDRLPTTFPMRAVAYSEALDAFVAVGPFETVLLRDQVHAGRLGNISTRGFVDFSGTALTAGFVVRGETPKRLLIRGVGPALAGFGVTGAVPRTTLTIYNSSLGTSGAVDSNTGWSNQPNSAAVAAAATQAGAFPLAAGSGDSALVLTLPPGVYTAQVSGAAGASGVALVEVYDLDAQANGYARAVNLSTRGTVRGGENILTAGVSVQGPYWRRFLIRGVGPSLARFGVTGTLADPRLRLASSRPLGDNFRQNSVTQNTNAADIAAATIAAGAFTFTEGAADTAIIVTLPAGNYTFELTSISGSTGNALIEVYDIGIPKL